MKAASTMASPAPTLGLVVVAASAASFFFVSRLLCADSPPPPQPTRTEDPATPSPTAAPKRMKSFLATLSSPTVSSCGTGLLYDIYIRRRKTPWFIHLCSPLVRMYTYEGKRRG